MCGCWSGSGGTCSAPSEQRRPAEGRARGSTDLLEEHAELVDVWRGFLGDLHCDVLLLDELDEGDVEVDHADLLGFDGLEELAELALASFEDVLADDGVVDEDFEGGDTGNLGVERGEEFLIDEG